MQDGLAASALRLDQWVDPLEYCYEQGWTDGLPVVPPTAERVSAMLSTAGKGAREVLGVLPPIGSQVTVEKVAINAVMAGCLPDYFPVVLTAVEAFVGRGPSVGSFLTTIHGDYPLIIVNGPVVKRLDFNAAANTFGPGWRANATVGRAVALVMRNVAAGPPGQFDVATHANPGKFTACIAEFEEASPWLPLHVERGLDPQDSVVTVMAGQGPYHVTDMASTRAEGVLTTLADTMCIRGSYNMYRGGEILLVLSPTHARMLAAEGWSKDDARYYLWEKARKPLDKLKDGGCYNWGGIFQWPKWVDTDDDNTLVPVVFDPRDITIVVAGGEVGGYSSVFFGLGQPSTTRIVSFA